MNSIDELHYTYDYYDSKVKVRTSFVIATIMRIVYTRVRRNADLREDQCASDTRTHTHARKIPDIALSRSILTPPRYQSVMVLYVAVPAAFAPEDDSGQTEKAEYRQEARPSNGT